MSEQLIKALVNEGARIMDALVVKSDPSLDRNQEIHDVEQWKAKARAALSTHHAAPGATQKPYLYGLVADGEPPWLQAYETEADAQVAARHQPGYRVVPLCIGLGTPVPQQEASGVPVWAIFRQRPDENNGVEFFHAALWHNDTVLSHGERYVRGYFVPASRAAATAPAGGVMDTEVDEALLSVDDFIARCNGDDRGSCEAVNILRRAITAARAAEPEDTKLLNWLREESCDLRCIDVPTGQGDGDVHWVVVGHYQAQPIEREVGRSYSDEPREAIRDAMRAASPTPPTGTSKEGGEKP